MLSLAEQVTIYRDNFGVTGGAAGYCHWVHDADEKSPLPVGRRRGELPANLPYEIANHDAIEGSCPLPHFLGQLGAERGFLLPAVKVHSLPDLPFLRTHSQGGQQHESRTG